MHTFMSQKTNYTLKTKRILIVNVVINYQTTREETRETAINNHTKKNLNRCGNNKFKM